VETSEKKSDIVLSVKNLTVSFDGFKAVDDLSFDIQRGELRVVIGPNGAGKTTVLDLISGKTKATGGQIHYDGQDISSLREHKIVRLGIGRKFQTPSIYENLTVFENFEISYPWGRNVFGSLGFVRSEKVIDRIANIAEEVGLYERMDVMAGLLSHGQKQWLEIGMILVQNPDLIMLDEPVAGMTAKERDLTVDLLKKISKGRSIIIIEHDMDFVAKIAHTVTVLHLGKILKEGSMDEVRNDPKVKEVYLGH
jgi:urea transport system ATP-binding protein